jgi:hypothetical protein
MKKKFLGKMKKKLKCRDHPSGNLVLLSNDEWNLVAVLAIRHSAFIISVIRNELADGGTIDKVEL